MVEPHRVAMSQKSHERKQKHKATYIAPIGIGLALFIAELAGVNFTGGSLNPARALGPDVVSTSFTSYHWIYCKLKTIRIAEDSKFQHQ